MFSKRKFEVILILFFIIFSSWLMDKSFGYDHISHQFRIARHQIGDFGLHLSLIRSFSWGDNFPPESPFFPGEVLPYHYYFDLLVGILERLGVRIDIAFNGMSILSFTLLLWLIYKLSQIIFGGNRLLGVLSVVLFIFHSNVTFIDFLRQKGLSLSLLHDIWFLPDYLHKGPFDGSIISLFFTLNVFLNQRHLILALVISLSIFSILLKRLLKAKALSYRTLLLLGVFLGLSSRVHTLTFLSTSVVVFTLLILFKRFQLLLPLFIPAGILFSSHAKDIFNQSLTYSFFNPGFLAEKPLSLLSFTTFWLLNLGVAFLAIPLGFFSLKNSSEKGFPRLFSTFYYWESLAIEFSN